jgi:hypothetical protein
MRLNPYMPRGERRHGRMCRGSSELRGSRDFSLPLTNTHQTAKCDPTTGRILSQAKTEPARPLSSSGRWRRLRLAKRNDKMSHEVSPSQ